MRMLLIGVALFVVIVAAGAGFVAIRSLLRDIRTRPFAEHIEEYLRDDAQLEEHNGEPYLAGKVIPITTGHWIKDREGQVDLIYFEMPEHLRAESPDEVGTVMRLNCRRQQKGSYSNLEPAYQSYCLMTLVDLRQSIVIETKRFEGPPPPERIGEYESTGERPIEEIVRYLETLPTR